MSQTQTQVVDRPITDIEIAAFCSAVEKMINDHYAKTAPKSSVLSRITFMRGPRYTRIVVSRWGSESVYCFLENDTGAILKSASWKAPAKHARGNILADNPLGGCTIYGAEYMR